MNRKPLIAANWKMNHNVENSIKFLTELKCSFEQDPEKIDVVICPPYTSLYIMNVALQEDNVVALGAQNCHFEDNGAFTGEVSTDFLTEFNCEYVIVGHSERRQYFNAPDETVCKKIHKVLNKGLIPIFCIGETDSEREENKTFDVIKRQLTKGLDGMTKDEVSEIVVAYEPIWAIGTGKTATPEQAQEVHAYIRKEIAKNFGTSYAAEVRILYGGSVKPNNIQSLMVQDDIDGALVGGASLKPEDFLGIIEGCKPR